MSHSRTILAASLLMTATGLAHAQTTRPGGGGGGAAGGIPPAERATYLRENYTKYEYKIPMRDGIHLYTAVYVPKDDSKTYPFLITRTPYTIKPYGEDLNGSPSGYYLQDKFIFVQQDVRGKNGSEGQFVHMRPIIEGKTGPKDIDESTDAYDTIDWLVKNVPENNGRAGMMGISYPGFYSACGMIDTHPALKCVSPQAPIADWFMGDDLHHNGAFYLPHMYGFFSWFGQTLEDPLRDTAKRFDFKTNDGYQFYLALGSLANVDPLYFHGKIEFWSDIMSHPNYDTFWQSRNLRPHLKNVHCAVMTVGGWYDAEDLFGTLAVYRETERLNPGIFNVLVMGPWSHGGWSGPDGDHLGNVRFDAKTSQYYRDNMELPFLKHFLKPEEEAKTGMKLAEANVFETGTNQWRRFDAWPPKNSAEKTLYLHAGGQLSFDPPTTGENPFDTYTSDPAKPVPYVGYTTIGMTREHMVDDQRFAATRPDVLVYQTDVLDEDMTLSGPISAALQISTSGTDSDFIVKLIDVYSNDFPNPDAPNTASSLPEGGRGGGAATANEHPPLQMGGYQQLVRAEAMRGKYRNSFEKPEPFTPGEAAKLNWTMPDIFHTFRRGHRIMVQVQSTWFPVVDRNPQTFCDIYHATAADFKKADERIYHTPDMASSVRIRILPRPTPGTMPAASSDTQPGK